MLCSNYREDGKCWQCHWLCSLYSRVNLMVGSLAVISPTHLPYLFIDKQLCPHWYSSWDQAPAQDQLDSLSLQSLVSVEIHMNTKNFTDITSIPETSFSVDGPVFKLPVEILQEIFTWSIPGLGEDLCLPFTNRSSTGGLLCTGDPHPDSVWVSIQSVCRYWGNVLHSTPAAWVTLIIDADQQQRNCYNKPHWLEKSLLLSGSHILEIFFCFQHAPHLLASILKPHFKRIVRVFCTAESQPFMELQLVYQISGGLRGSFPRLAELVFIGNGVGHALFDTGVLKGQILLPSLKNLSRHSSLVQHPTHNTLLSITLLNSIGITLSPAQLADCQNLCNLDISSRWHPWTGSMPPQLQLLLLRVLWLQVNDIKIAVQFTDSLWAPELEYLYLYNTTGAQVNSAIGKSPPFIHSLSKIGSTQVKHLHFCGVAFPHFEWKSKSPFELFPPSVNRFWRWSMPIKSWSLRSAPMNSQSSCRL